MNINDESANLIINLLAKEVESLREQLAAERRESNICRSHATELQDKVSTLSASIAFWEGENRSLREERVAKSALKSEELLQLFPTYQDAAKHLAAQYSQERILAIRALRNFVRGVEGYPLSLRDAKNMIEEQRELLGLNAKEDAEALASCRR